ncbi:hypothetical protein SVI_1513 [Shewanella violacea DSS12]|uniref:Uncharacterized protein n=1 Tax=Shewanella violacea (strain JCM 10179 / CIP 106290 / LMG 19151 / DSS12) TaxID=637905 RepID=D4ZII5_SHEVD|nr:hypothetical protein SVI_1513 [Shewanella violacea DSS12]
MEKDVVAKFFDVDFDSLMINPVEIWHRLCSSI